MQHQKDRRARRIVLALTIAAAAGGARGEARAQSSTGSGFAVDRFEPAGGGSEWFSLESLDFRGQARPSFGLVVDGAWKPLVVFDQNGNPVATMLRDQLVGHADAAVVLKDRLRLDVNLPVVLYQQGTALILNDQTYTAPAHQALGDVRLGADLLLYGQSGDPFIAAAGVQAFAPTGATSAFTGDGKWRFWPRLLLAGNVRTFSWAARFGYHVRPTCDCSLGPGDELTAALAAGVRPSSRVLIGPEVYVSTARAHLGQAVASPLELLVGAHFAVAPAWTLSVGVAPGLTDGAGSPTVRGVVGLQYFPPIAKSAVAPRPAVAAPPAAVRKPPLPPPPPADVDRDVIRDAEDACPAEAGATPAELKKNGCLVPKDTDGDGILDPEDACPEHPGPRNDDPARNGCPVVRIESGQIRIREQVQFKTDSAQILKESDEILQAVVKVLRENPEIKKVRIEGHTDTQGKPRHNKTLSKRRAASVVKWLVSHGIKKNRLTSAGYGQERPIATNMTEAGRYQNRRVELHIVVGPGGEKSR